jgi:autotransporter family porin
VNFCKIIGNTPLDIYRYDGSVNAEYNWWGSNASPSGRVYGVTIYKWLVLTVAASPTSIGNYKTSTITADLRHDNTGALHTEGYVPNGMPVIFKTTLGTITSQSSTVNGIAKSTLKSGSTAGTATISAKIDSQTATKSVKIVDTIAPKVTSTTPKNKATGISRSSTIAIKFSENIKASTYWSKIYIKDKYGKKVSISKWIKGNTLYIKTTRKRLSYSYYTVYIPAYAVKDYTGNKLATRYTFKFKTGKY